MASKSYIMEISDFNYYNDNKIDCPTPVVFVGKTKRKLYEKFKKWEDEQYAKGVSFLSYTVREFRRK